MAPDVKSTVAGVARAATDPAYANVTLRYAALLAATGPAMLRSFYDNREQVLAAAKRIPTDHASVLPALISPGLDGMGARVVRMTLTVVGEQRVRHDVTSMVVTPAKRIESAAQMVAEFMNLSVVDALTTALGVPDARLRANLITAHLSGMVVTRYVLRLEPMASASQDDMVVWYGPMIQQLLDPTIPVKAGP